MAVPLLLYLDRLFTRDLEGLAREIALFPDDETLWKTLPGVANSAGNLGLHVAGNLQHFVGAVLGATGYARNREIEFSRRSGSRAEVIAGLEKTRVTLQQVLPAIPEERLAAPYPETLGGSEIETGLFLLHLAGHLTFHLGQVGYLRRILTGSSETSGAIPLAALAITER